MRATIVSVRHLPPHPERQGRWYQQASRTWREPSVDLRRRPQRQHDQLHSFGSPACMDGTAGTPGDLRIWRECPLPEPGGCDVRRRGVLRRRLNLPLCESLPLTLSLSTLTYLLPLLDPVSEHAACASPQRASQNAFVFFDLAGEQKLRMLPEAQGIRLHQGRSYPAAASAGATATTHAAGTARTTAGTPSDTTRPTRPQP